MTAEAVRLAERLVKEKLEGQRGLDGDVRVLSLAATFADTDRLPLGYRRRRPPDGDVAPLH